MITHSGSWRRHDEKSIPVELRVGEGSAVLVGPDGEIGSWPLEDVVIRSRPEGAVEFEAGGGTYLLDPDDLDRMAGFVTAFQLGELDAWQTDHPVSTEVDDQAAAESPVSDDDAKTSQPGGDGDGGPERHPELGLFSDGDAEPIQIDLLTSHGDGDFIIDPGPDLDLTAMGAVGDFPAVLGRAENVEEEVESGTGLFDAAPDGSDDAAGLDDDSSETYEEPGETGDGRLVGDESSGQEEEGDVPAADEESDGVDDGSGVEDDESAVETEEEGDAGGTTDEVKEDLEGEESWSDARPVDDDFSETDEESDGVDDGPVVADDESSVELGEEGDFSETDEESDGVDHGLVVADDESPVEAEEGGEDWSATGEVTEETEEPDLAPDSEPSQPAETNGTTDTPEGPLGGSLTDRITALESDTQSDEELRRGFGQRLGRRRVAASPPERPELFEPGDTEDSPVQPDEVYPTDREGGFVDEESPSLRIESHGFDEGGTVADAIVASQRQLRDSSKVSSDLPRVIKRVALISGVVLILGGFGVGAVLALRFLSSAPESDPSTPVVATEPTTVTSLPAPSTTVAVSSTMVETTVPVAFDLTGPEFVRRWNEVAGSVIPDLRMPGLVPGDFEFQLTPYITASGTLAADGVLDSFGLILDPTGPQEADAQGIQAMGLMLAVIDPGLSGPERKELLASMGFDVEAPSLVGLDSVASRNGVSYSLVYDEETVRLLFSAKSQ